MRLNELLNAIKFSSGETLVLFSHSNILKELMGRRVNKELRAAKPDLTRTAGKCKLNNCSVVRLDLDFTMDLAHCIVGLEPLFVRDGSDAFERHKAKAATGGDEGSRPTSSSQPRPPDSSPDSSSRPRPPGDGKPPVRVETAADSHFSRGDGSPLSAAAGSGGGGGDQASADAAPLDLPQPPALLQQRTDAPR